MLICTACSGVHRSLGVEHSFVQSLKLDSWCSAAVHQLARSPGTAAVNARLEYHVPAAHVKPTTRSSREVREAFITAKCSRRHQHAQALVLSSLFSRYVHRLFIARDGAELPAKPAVYDSAGSEERDASARYKLLLDVQDAFSQHSGLISSVTVGSKQFHDCFSGSLFMKWLRDEGGKHLTAHGIDFSHEGEMRVARFALRLLVRAVVS